VICLLLTYSRIRLHISGHNDKSHGPDQILELDKYKLRWRTLHMLHVVIIHLKGTECRSSTPDNSTASRTTFWSKNLKWMCPVWCYCGGVFSQSFLQCWLKRQKWSRKQKENLCVTVDFTKAFFSINLWKSIGLKYSVPITQKFISVTTDLGINFFYYFKYFRYQDDLIKLLGNYS